jgi:hypothetical protein
MLAALPKTILSLEIITPDFLFIFPDDLPSTKIDILFGECESSLNEIIWLTFEALFSTIRFFMIL